jgi:hypothetical protein
MLTTRTPKPQVKGLLDRLHVVITDHFIASLQRFSREGTDCQHQEVTTKVAYVLTCLFT